MAACPNVSVHAGTNVTSLIMLGYEQPSACELGQNKPQSTLEAGAHLSTDIRDLLHIRKLGIAYLICMNCYYLSMPRYI